MTTSDLPARMVRAIELLDQTVSAVEDNNLRYGNTGRTWFTVESLPWFDTVDARLIALFGPDTARALAGALRKMVEIHERHSYYSERYSAVIEQCACGTTGWPCPTLLAWSPVVDLVLTGLGDRRVPDPADAAGHRFTVTVELQGHGANWSSELKPVTVRAWDLAEALRLVSEKPVTDWFPTEDEEQGA